MLSDETRDTLSTDEPINLVDVCRHLLRIVARLESSLYTDPTLRQTVEVALDDPADPASEESTTQG